MPTDRNERVTLSDEERRFVERFGEAYAPREPVDARRAAFDAAVRERLERPQRGWLWLPSAAVAAAATFLLWIALPETQSPDPGRDTGTSVVADAAWEMELVYGDLEANALAAETEQEQEALGDSLPPEYAAIDHLFFEEELLGS